MRYTKAARILRGMGMHVGSYRLKKEIEPTVNTELGDDDVFLEGNFTADQLEAIALWMRKPNEVTNA